MKQTDGSKKAKAAIGNSARKRNDPVLGLWRTHGAEDVYFQREAQVNFWTVLGGLAMAALLTQLSPLLRELLDGRWYLLLYFVASILVIANSWVQTTWGSLVLKWPISIATTIFVLFGMLAQSIQCLLVTIPSGWLVATAGCILSALLMQVYFERSGAWEVYSPESIKRFKIVNGLYLLLMLICLAGAYQLYRYPSHLSELIWGFIAFFFSIAALYIQHLGMQAEKKLLDIP